MMIKTVAIDDEPLALQLIEGYIKRTPYLQLEGSFTSSVDALDHISNNETDLIFLDIQMPDLTGTELARVIAGGPKIIFTTAYEKYALEGFKLDAIDYLLKPFSYEEFLKAAARAKKRLEMEAAEPLRADVKDGFLFLKSEYKIRRINFNEIHYIEGLKDYIKVYLINEKKPVLSLSSLKIMEKKLPSERFMRVHRSYIVNLDTIKTIERNRIVFGDTRIPVGDQYKERFQKFLEENFL